MPGSVHLEGRLLWWGWSFLANQQKHLLSLTAKWHQLWLSSTSSSQKPCLSIWLIAVISSLTLLWDFSTTCWFTAAVLLPSTWSMMVGQLQRTESGPQSPARCSMAAGLSPNTTIREDNHRDLRVNVPIYDNGWAITVSLHLLTGCTCVWASPLKSLLLHSVFAGSCDEEQLKHLAPYKKGVQAVDNMGARASKELPNMLPMKRGALVEVNGSVAAISQQGGLVG